MPSRSQVFSRPSGASIPERTTNDVFIDGVWYNTDPITPSYTLSVTPSVTPTLSVTPSVGLSPTATPSLTPTRSVSLSPSVTPSLTPTHSVGASASVTPSLTPSLTPTHSLGASASVTPTITPTVTPTHSLGASASVTPSLTPTPTITPSLPGNAEPMYVPGNGTLLHQDLFNSYVDDAALMANYATMNGESGLHYDSTGGISGTGAMRIDWLTQAQGPCTDDSHLIEKGLPGSPTEVYVQYSVRYQSGFIFDWNGQSPCVGNAKKMFWLWSGSNTNRFGFLNENHWLGMGSDVDHPLHAQTAGPEVTLAMWGDGNWHRVTIHVRQSSAPTVTDGLIEGWIDGVQRWSVPNWASNSGGGWPLFKMPTTFNAGSPVDQSEWLDSLTIWAP